MWFRYLTITVLLLGFCWLFKPIFVMVLKSIKKIKNDFKKVK